MAYKDYKFFTNIPTKTGSEHFLVIVYVLNNLINTSVCFLTVGANPMYRKILVAIFP